MGKNFADIVNLSFILNSRYLCRNKVALRKLYGTYFFERSPKRIAGRILSSVNVASELPRRVSVSSRPVAGFARLYIFYPRNRRG